MKTDPVCIPTCLDSIQKHKKTFFGRNIMEAKQCMRSSETYTNHTKNHEIARRQWTIWVDWNDWEHTGTFSWFCFSGDFLFSPFLFRGLSLGFFFYFLWVS